MTRCSSLAGLLGATWMVAGALGCARADASAPASQAASTRPDAANDQAKATTPSPDPAAAVQTALKWLSALRQRDRTGLVRQSSAPFVVRDASGTGDCSTIDVTAPSGLNVIGCLAKDDVLHDVLKDTPEPEAGPLSPKHLPNWARKWKADVASGSLPIGVVLLGKKVSFDLVVLVGADGVHGLFRHTAHDRN